MKPVLFIWARYILAFHAKSLLRTNRIHILQGNVLLKYAFIKVATRNNILNRTEKLRILKYSEASQFYVPPCFASYFREIRSADKRKKVLLKEHRSKHSCLARIGQTMMTLSLWHPPDFAKDSLVGVDRIFRNSWSTRYPSSGSSNPELERELIAIGLRGITLSETDGRFVNTSHERGQLSRG